MTIKDVSYNNIISLLVNLSVDSNNITAYSDGLENQEKQDLLIFYAEKVENEILNIINIAKEENRLIIFDVSIFNIVTEYSNHFADYPEARYEEILLILTLLNLLNNVSQEEMDLNFDDEVDDSTYSLIDFGDDKFGTDIFHFDDLSEQRNSFIFFNFAEIEQLIRYFQNQDISISSDLLILFLAKIGNEDFQLFPKYYALLFRETAVSKAKSKAYIAINLVMNGEIFHKPYEYTKKISLGSQRPLSVFFNYHQFKDILTILSEYGAQDDILDKFLRLYHVVENFMFKSPLVNLEREQQGQPFSFRDFQRIHNNINRSEIESLKKLVKKVLPLDRKNGVTFANYIYNELRRIISSDHLITINNFNSLISLLKLEKKKNGDDYGYSDITVNNIDKYYSEILYAIRCSIVHNKESEFHLTHDVLFNHTIVGDTTKTFIEEFLMPTMEEIVIFLLTESDNDIVWFSNDTLMLWETA